VTKDDNKMPNPVRISIVFMGLIALIAVLYISRSIVVPLVFATIIAILLNPIVNFFIRLRLNRIVAIVMALLITFILLFGLGGLFISQISRLVEAWPTIIDKFTQFLNEGVIWAGDLLNIKPKKIDIWILETKESLLEKGSGLIGQSLSSIGHGLIVMLLIPVYIFMILFYQSLILEFIQKLFGKEHQTQVGQIVSQTKTVVQKYLVGLVIETIIVATLNTTVLLILGVDYALLLGVIGALLNLIPYIGGIVGVALPMIVVMVTQSSIFYSFYVLIGYYVIQLIDNNLIVPLIVASKVKINALFSVIVVIVGNALWGIPGMFLSIPLLAIVKLICDNVESLKPWGLLLGDTLPISRILSIEPLIKKIKKKL
jgi:predicted PurR-regulated permease PerM